MNTQTQKPTLDPLLRMKTQTPKTKLPTLGSISSLLFEEEEEVKSQPTPPPIQNPTTTPPQNPTTTTTPNPTTPTLGSTIENLPWRVPCIKNLSSSIVEMSKPWEIVDPSPKEMWSNPEFSSRFYSLIEGVNPNIRVSTNNPGQLIYGLVCDYDHKISESQIEEALGKSEHKPTLVSRTTSGGCRLIWIFENPILFPHNYRTLSRFLVKKLNARRLLPGLDEGAARNSFQYYHCGVAWSLTGKPISDNVILSWMVEFAASDPLPPPENQPIEIPLEIVAEEIERRFPGRWKGPFKVGSRGVRFWDPTADNPTAAVVHPHGMRCFTGTKPFISWREIFGDKWYEDIVGNFIDSLDIYHDGKSYWKKLSGVWYPFSREQISNNLQVEFGIDSSKRGKVSNLQKTLNFIDTQKRIDGAAPFIFRKEKIVKFENKRYLNTSRVTPCPPSDEKVEWGEGFPFISSLLDNFFSDPSETQKIHFLSWLKYGYENAINGNPKNGQPIFLAGPVGRGKTLISHQLIGGLFGGRVDCSQFLLGETRFNSKLFESGVWTIDDTTPSTSQDSHRLFSAMVKSIASNYSFKYEEKFRVACEIPWSGRLIVTCNTDPESLRIFPDLTISLMDKIMIFLVSETQRPWEPGGAFYGENPASLIQEELQYFGSYLLKTFSIPENLKEPRFGVKPFHHPQLVEEIIQLSPLTYINEVIDMWFRDKTTWEGTSAELLAELQNNSNLSWVVDKISADKLGRILRNRVSSPQPGDNITLSYRVLKGRCRWKFTKVQ